MILSISLSLDVTMVQGSSRGSDWHDQGIMHVSQTPSWFQMVAQSAGLCMPVSGDRATDIDTGHLPCFRGSNQILALVNYKGTDITLKSMWKQGNHASLSLTTLAFSNPPLSPSP